MPFVPIGTVNGHSVREWRASLFFPMVKLRSFIVFLAPLGSKIVFFVEIESPRRLVGALLDPAGTKMSPSGGKTLHSVGGVRRILKKEALLRETCASLGGQVVISLQSGVGPDVETS